jgi:large subunit ribosomal protein L17
MQHNRAGRKLGRTTAHRRALFRNQLASLLQHERITTTLHKAKDLRPLAEKMVTLGKRGGLHARRLALKSVPESDVIQRLFDEIAPRFKERVGGYTRILKLGRRPGDGAEMAIIEFVDYDFAERRAKKVQAEKAASEKKETLLEKAKKLVTGKAGSEKAAGDEVAGGEEPKADKKAKAEKTPKAPKAAKAPKASRAPKAQRPASGGKKGPTKGGTPRKVGGG